MPIGLLSWAGGEGARVRMSDYWFRDVEIVQVSRQDSEAPKRIRTLLILVGRMGILQGSNRLSNESPYQTTYSLYARTNLHYLKLLFSVCLHLFKCSAASSTHVIGYRDVGDKLGPLSWATTVYALSNNVCVLYNIVSLGKIAWIYIYIYIHM